MARQKVVETLIQLDSWQDADDALRTIGEHMRDIAAVENVMNEQIAAAKAAAEAKARSAKEQIALLETALRVFTTERRDDLGKLKSKTLNFGTVSFRKSTKVKLPSAAAKLKAIIDALRAKGGGGGGGGHDRLHQPARPEDRQGCPEKVPGGGDHRGGRFPGGGRRLRVRRGHGEAAMSGQDKFSPSDAPVVKAAEMVSARTWDDFRESGLLWWINTILHTFGWAIVCTVDDDNKATSAFPARVRFRGFDDKSTQAGYCKVSAYMVKNAETLLREAEE